MIVIEQQLHGYKHGHELLSTSVRLPARDQDLLDRLSDVAGPLGPGERFLPYLTCYPLPSGSHYVLARTWQDLATPRAGCVRTRSLLIRMQDWMSLVEPAALAEAVSVGGPSGSTETISIPHISGKPLPRVEGVGTELLEALFLEDRMPVAVFGAEMPEVIALRLLTAVWPSYRRNFTLSTFCNSPRSIAKKSFDLVFAPVDARSRFSDWKGRRIDGRRSSAARHRWSESIVDRVFHAQNPSLRGLDVLGEMAGDERGREDALRVSLLWDELYRRVASEPHAALGLLDIANTRAARNPELIGNLGPALASAASTAVSTMPPRDAWGFLQTLAGKVGDSKLRLSAAKSIRSSAISLSRKCPDDAVGVVPIILGKDGQNLLLGALGDGLVGSTSNDVASLLGQLQPTELVKLLIASPTLAKEILSNRVVLDAQITAGLEEAEPELLASAQRRFLRHMIGERHADAFRILVSGMSGKKLVAQIARLNDATGLRSPSLNTILVDEARRTGAVPLVRDFVAALEQSPATDGMLIGLIEPKEDDVRWLLEQPFFSTQRRRSLLLTLIDTAPVQALTQIFSEPILLTEILGTVGHMDDDAVEAMARITENAPLANRDVWDLLLQVIPRLKGLRATHLAARGLYEGLGKELGASRETAVRYLLESAGEGLDAANAIRVALSTKVPPEIASQNLILIESAPPAVRAQFVKVPQTLVESIVGRRVLDLSYEGADAAGRLLWDASAGGRPGFARTAVTLLSFAMHERCQSASALIAAVFPSVYRGLQQERIPDLLTLMFSFVDWDRCKLVRRELAAGFSSSDWLATDMAIAAARAGDTTRILKNIAGSYRGQSALLEIERDIERIQPPWRRSIQQALVELRKGTSE